jgi:hypothetical protein
MMYDYSLTRLETNLKYTDMAMWKSLSPQRITKKNRSRRTKTVAVAVVEAARYCQYSALTGSTG